MQRSNFERMRIAVKISYRNECLRRCGLKQNISRQELRICNYYRIEQVKQLVRWEDLKGKRVSTFITMNLPSSEEIQRVTTTSSNGLGTDRQNMRVLHRAIDLLNDYGERNEEMWETILSQSFLSTSFSYHPTNEIEHINPSLGINMMKIRTSELTHNSKNNTNTMISINDLSDKQIRLRAALTTLVCHVIQLNRGEFEKIIKTSTYLSWFEEWLVFFDTEYGRKFRRKRDTGDYYDISKDTVTRVFESKMLIVMESRANVPRYATLTEDEMFRKERWNATYKNVSLVMWDTTDAVKIYQSTDAHVQRLTYNPYYGGNVGKGGIFIQPCGWMGTHEIWTGGVSDTEYFIKSGILQQQQQYLHEENNSEGEEITFTNMLDKGFCVVFHCWNVGNQTVIQPNFSRSNRRLSAYEVIRSAAIASDRGGNERAVRYSKMSGFLAKGLGPNQKCVRGSHGVTSITSCSSHHCETYYNQPNKRLLSCRKP